MKHFWLVYLVLSAAIGIGLVQTGKVDAASITTLHPVSYTTLTGSDGGQMVNALWIQDETGSDDHWDRYVEFYTPGTVYKGYRTYTLPAGIDPASITALQVRANYRGPLHSRQVWRWYLYNWSQSSWALLGDNTAAKDWIWTPLTFDATGALADYVNSGTGQIRVLLKSGSAVDDADLDFEAVVVTTGGPGSTPTATLTAPPTTPAATTTDPPPTATPIATSTNLPPSLTPTTPSASSIWHPRPGTTWQWQLSGTVDTSYNVQMYDIDLFDTPQSTIDTLHAAGRVVVCYISAGTLENWRPDAALFPLSVLGSAVSGWPGETWLDIRQIALLGPIMGARMDLAVSKHCDGIEPDNIDGYANNTGLPLTYQDQIAYNSWLVIQAHQRNLSIGLKNDLDQIPDLMSKFDWALDEQCFQYSECDTLKPFVAAGKAVFGVEYQGNTATFCPQANALGYSWMLKHLSLDAYQSPCW